MRRLIAFLMIFLHSPMSMSKMLKNHIQGLAYLLLHPLQLKRLIIRETRYGQRNLDKRNWVEWQIYDTCVANAPHTTAVAHAQPLNTERVETISDMVSHIGSGLEILDVGCGDGTIGEPLRKMGNHVTSMELPGAANLAYRRGIPLVVAGDAEHLTFTSNSFDVVLASEIVEHLWNPHNFFDDAYRILKAIGYLIISTPEGEAGLSYDSHKHYFTVVSLQQMLASGFAICEVKRLKPAGAPMPTIILLLRKLMIQK